MANIGNHTFIDGVGDLRLHEGIVRMDLLALSPTGRDKDGNPSPEFVSQIVMSPAAFLRTVSALGDTVRQMQEQGMLASGSASEAKSEAVPEAEKPSPKKAKARKKKKAAKKSGSPNF